MDPKPSEGDLLLAPSGRTGALRMPAAQDFPSLDERLVEPETPEEMIRGRKVHVLPALDPHADRQCELSYVIRAHVRPGYVGSAELLTRASVGSDFATDVCVRRQGTDPATGTRYLEELSFEIVNEQSERDIREKAEDLTARGVRRVIAIFVKTSEVREWSTKTGAWRKLDPNAILRDPTLARPLRVRELLDAAAADDAVVEALRVKGNPAIARVMDEGRAEGRAEGLRAAVGSLCRVLAIPLTAEREAALARMGAEQLDALRERIERDRRWE